MATPRIRSGGGIVVVVVVVVVEFVAVLVGGDGGYEVVDTLLDAGGGLGPVSTKA